MPGFAYFVCEDRTADAFWQPKYQTHPNGVTGLAAVYAVSDDPAEDARFAASLFGGSVTPRPDGVSVTCGARHAIRFVPRGAASRLDPTFDPDRQSGMIGFALTGANEPQTIPAADGHGAFIGFVA